MVKPIVHIDANFIEEQTSFKELIEELKNQFCSQSLIVPDRSHHEFPGRSDSEKNTLLLMPAWNPQLAGGVKVLTLNPENPKHGVDTIQGLYLYLNPLSGIIEALLDARVLTSKRTAAASALASSYLSRKDSKILLVLGTGPIAENLIKAHVEVRAIKQIYVWGRNHEKAKQLVSKFADKDYDVEAIESYQSFIGLADIISCATSSQKPLLRAEDLRKGQHLDLVGSYKRSMREVDDKVMQISSIYVDTMHAVQESGDLILPIENQVISLDSVISDLFHLCIQDQFARQLNQEITVYKSVGHALEDLAAAHYLVKKYNRLNEHL